MGYNYVVCVKQVPDINQITGETMKEDGTVNRDALPAIFNPDDLNALEEAMAIRERCGGTVTVVTMGPPAACEVLRKALFLGADRVILLSDRRAAASDTLATSYILSCAIKKLGHDIVFCGRQAIDSDTAQVGPQLAQKLDLTLVTYLEEFVEIQDGRAKIRRNLGTGWELVSCKLPLLLTVIDTANVPRPPAAKRFMKFKKALARIEVEMALAKDMPDAGDDERSAEADKRCEALAQKGLLIEQWNLDDIEANIEWCGLSGSPTKIHRVQSVKLAGGEYKQFPPTDEGVAELIKDLIEEHTIG